jgi:sulfonate transport system ATP-binding protein
MKRDRIDPPLFAPAGDPTGVHLRVEGLHKRYGARGVLRRLSLQLARGEFVAVVGRSGCGKSTLLRIIAGLETADEGSIQLNGSPQKNALRELRVIFQEPRLLPWRRVLENVAIGLPENQWNAARQVLARVGLADCDGDWPAQLSGGERQRVALARALVHRPRLLLLDEPLGALDALTRIEMQQLIEGLWRVQNFSALLVTHDVQEAIALADRVLLIEEGVVTFEQRVDLPRPRVRGSIGFAALEERVLRHVLGQPSVEANGPQTGSSSAVWKTIGQTESRGALRP